MMMKHEMPDGSMMSGEAEEMGEPEEMAMPAGLQAEALSQMGADATIQALHKKLAAHGDAAAQPTTQKGFDGLLSAGQMDYSEVEPSDPELG
jgi:hypothetical protein